MPTTCSSGLPLPNWFYLCRRIVQEQDVLPNGHHSLQFDPLCLQRHLGNILARIGPEIVVFDKGAHLGPDEGSGSTFPEVLLILRGFYDLALAFEGEQGLAGSELVFRFRLAQPSLYTLFIILIDSLLQGLVCEYLQGLPQRVESNRRSTLLLNLLFLLEICLSPWLELRQVVQEGEGEWFPFEDGFLFCWSYCLPGGDILGGHDIINQSKQYKHHHHFSKRIILRLCLNCDMSMFWEVRRPSKPPSSFCRTNLRNYLIRS